MSEPPPIDPDVPKPKHALPLNLAVWFAILLAVVGVLVLRSCIKTVDRIAEGLGGYTTGRVTPGLGELEVQQAERLFASFLSSPRDTRRRWINRPLVVEGRLRDVDVESDPPILVLDAGRGQIQCHLTTPSGEAWRQILALSPGQTVTLGGVVDWMNRGTIAVRRAKLKVDFPPPPQRR